MPAGAATGAARAWRSLERAADRVFGADINPLRQLGGLGFFLFWLIVISGGWLYVFYETSVEGAWDSVQHLTVAQWWGGGLMRSLHRYGSDAFVVVVGLHLVRELALGRYTGFRWYSWISGVPTLWLIIGSGVIGYWMVWDERALFAATATAEWFGVLPGFDPALVRNFLVPEAVSDRLFSLLAFLHIGLPLALLLVMWAHVQRLTRPRSAIHRRLAGWTLAWLLGLSLVWPAQSLAPADPQMLPDRLALDWFYLAPLAASDAGAPGLVWTFVLGITLVLMIAPWLTHAPRPAPAEVDPEHCSGCARCFEDCPYAAIAMAPHPGGRGQIAVVDADRCAACGICAGACPSSTPFRRSERLVSGIDLPWLTVDALRQQVDAALAMSPGPDPVPGADPAPESDSTPESDSAPTILVFGCAHGAHPGSSPAGSAGIETAGSRVRMITLPCAGMLPPSFIEYAQRHGADGVVVAACPGDDCEYRFGSHWLAGRLAGEREPRLRAAADGTRLLQMEVAREEGVLLDNGIASLARGLNAARAGSIPETEEIGDD